MGNSKPSGQEEKSHQSLQESDFGSSEEKNMAQSHLADVSKPEKSGDRLNNNA